MMSRASACTHESRVVTIRAWDSRSHLETPERSIGSDVQWCCECGAIRTSRSSWILPGDVEDIRVVFGAPNAEF